jgi:hypothetical protein
VKISKRLALTSAALVGVAIAIPASALPHAASADGQTACADGTVTWSPTSIWPPNHKMQTVTINYTAPADNPDQGDTTTITVDSVVDDQAGTDGSGELQGSGQPTDQQGLDWGGIGNSDTSAEGQTATTTAQVRAERSGLVKAGRTYTITVSCTEQSAAGTPNPMDSGMATLTVTVPHSMGQSNG